MTLIQPRGSTPGPWEVVGDPFDRSGCFVVGRNKLGGPAGDPHVCPEVARTDPLECYDCDEGNHPHDVHEADARLAACAPEFYALALQRVRSIARGNKDVDSCDCDDCAWARAAGKVIAKAGPQRMTLHRGAYVYPASLPLTTFLDQLAAWERDAS